MSRGWENNVRRVIPYVPGEQPKMANLIKLNTNENPYPPSPLVQEALRRQESGLLRLYPDPACESLIRSCAQAFHVPEECVFAGVGSDDVLAMSFLAFFNGDKPVLFPDITYSFYDVWAGLFRIPYVQIPLDESFRIRPEDYERENGGIVIANPNAPTGEVLAPGAIRQILSRNPDSVVIIDEAYIDFGGTSALELIREFDQLLVVRTMSKSYSLAGMRIGFAFGQEPLIRYLKDVKYSFNSYTMNAPSLAAGEAALRDQEWFRTCRDKVIATREKTKAALRELGFVFGDSQANFLFITHPQISAKKLSALLRARGIIVRYFDRPRIDNYLRITIGTDEQMDVLTEVLRNIVCENKETPLDAARRVSKSGNCSETGCREEEVLS